MPLPALVDIVGESRATAIAAPAVTVIAAPASPGLAQVGIPAARPRTPGFRAKNADPMVWHAARIVAGMLRHPRTALVMFALAVGVSSLACGGGTQTDTPQPQAVSTSPTSGLKVTSAISAASLGESYANVQLAFIAEAANQAASVEVVSITLVDATSGSVVDTLEASSPQVWNGSGYVPWNQRVTPGGDLKATYQLTAPDWSAIDQGGAGGRTAYSRAFKMRVTLRIDGVDVLMQSVDLHRESQFQT